MKLVKTLAIVACASLLSVGVVGSAHRANAQDAAEGDQGAWSAAGPSDANQADLAAKAPPLNIFGCWEGSVHDTIDGTGTAVFQFNQSNDGKKLLTGSTFNFFWPDNSFAHGPMKGSVTSKGFKFKGNAGKGCPISGSGTGDDTLLTGKAKFGGECGKFFKNVTFTVTPGCI